MQICSGWWRVIDFRHVALDKYRDATLFVVKGGYLGATFKKTVVNARFDDQQQVWSFPVKFR